LFNDLIGTFTLSSSAVLVVLNKADLVDNNIRQDIKNYWERKLKDLNISPQSSVFLTSCLENSGLDSLEEGLSSNMKQLMATGDNFSSDNLALITRERHRHHTLICVEHLERFLENRLPMDAAAEEIRYALFKCCYFFSNLLAAACSLDWPC
jgi:tRNA U34 5-carboxymethylaminomethyl modifying GTPase MnmE/TrmE